MIKLTRDEFIGLALKAYHELPPGLAAYIDNLEIEVEDWPSPETLRLADVSHREDLFGLYEGVPRSQRGDYLPAMPDHITLFQGPLEAICSSEEHLALEIRKTLLHEIGHYMGMDEEDLERLGYS